MGLTNANHQLEPTARTEGQWRLSRVEVYNWGTFDGYHAFDVSRDGLLLTGASGSGKSTIIDAISTVISPAAKMSYNAAASNGAKRDRGRNYNNYVRGAWGHISDAEGETTRKFLRDRIATWSGILLRFEDGCDTSAMGPAEAARHDTINLVAIFFQKRNSTSDETIRSLYAHVRGACSLVELEPYGRKGADTRQFNKDFKSRGQAWQQHTPFLDRVCSLMHIRGKQTLALLQKTQAAKNIGSLDDLFRRYMLDQPPTFSQADAAVEQFENLENAHAGVVRQRQQMEMLAPLDDYDKEYEKQESRQQEATDLKNACPYFAETLIIEVLDDALSLANERENLLREQLAECEAAYSRAKQGYDTAAAILNDKGGIALTTAEMDVLQRQREERSITESRTGLERALDNVGLGHLPRTLHEYEALRKRVRTLAEEERQWLDQHDTEKVRLYGEVDSLIKHLAEIDRELSHLRSLKSNIPLSLHEIRKDIASYLGLALADVPFVGELIDVKPEEASWQGAIERLLRNRAQTMLIDKRFAPAVSEFLENRHLGLRFEYDGVPEEVSVPAKTLNEHSLVRKVIVELREGHENHTYWVNQILRKSFDYICVESPSQMINYSHALTRGGQIKSGEHHVKDDRSRINDKTHWVLGSANDAKIAQLEQDHTSLAAQLNRARAGTRELDKRMQRMLFLQQLAEELEARSWDELDIESAKNELAKAHAFYENLLRNDDFKQAQLQRDAAHEAMEDARIRRDKARVEIEVNRNNAESLLDQRAQHAEWLAEMERQDGAPTDAQALMLRNLFKQSDSSYRSSVEKAYQVKDRVNKELDRRIENALRAQQNARGKSEVIMQQFKDTFKAEGANLTASFDDRSGFIARYRQIKSTGLAQYEDKFLKVLTDFSRDQITVIATEIRNAFRDVRDRLEPVNRSLMLSPYSPGVHLQIEVREARSARVDQFLTDLREITTGSWETDDLAQAELRYERTASIMRRLKSPERADREWRRECLNTPEHMKFIAKEIDVDGSIVNVHSNDEGLSGGQKQKLVFFCLAAALRYQLSDDEAQVPSYGTIVLDEAFDKSDRHFAEEALDIFKAFNFHMVLATPGKLLQTIEGHVGGIVLVTCDDGRHSRLSPVIFEGLE